MRLQHTLLGAALMLAAGLSPALAQGALLTDDDVIANCGNELRAFDQHIIEIRQNGIANDTKWRDTYRQSNTALAQNAAANNQASIDRQQADIDDLKANGFRSTSSWLHFGGTSSVDFINATPVATLRKVIADYRNEIRQGNGGADLAIQLCAREARLAKLEGGPQAAPQPMPTPPTRTAANTTPPAPAPAPRGSAEPQFGGGASTSPKAMVADTQPVNQCVVLHAAGEKGNFGRLENVCGFPVSIRFCNDKTKPGSWESAMACGSGAVWGGTSDIAAHTLSADHVGGQVYWFACKKPSDVTEAKFVPGKGITAHCR